MYIENAFKLYLRGETVYRIYDMMYMDSTLNPVRMELIISVKARNLIITKTV